MALVKLIDLDGLKSLRTRRGEEYFEMSVPQIGSFIEYYKYDDGDIFKGEPVLYEIDTVTQELQEHFNGSYKERFKVELVKISE
ncbi:TPA: hypothetical protein ACGXM3_005274 [Bacillus cereus]